MSFISIQFLFFMGIVFIVYYRFPAKYRNLFLLVASYVFYGLFDYRFIMILFSYSIIAYISGILMDQNPKQKKLFLVFTLIIYIGVLLGLKYLGFFTSIMVGIFPNINLELSANVKALILPIGISFYSFQSIAYVVDVYRGSIDSERNFIDLSLFIAFFPQITSGPISRAKNLLPQLKRTVVFDFPLVEAGTYQFIWGMFKKIVIADQLSMIVNSVFDNYVELSAIQILIGVFSYSIQVYADFSGYSDMAIGLAKILGIDLGINFKNPYFARSIKDFWSRWHISLSTWFRDYLYFPLGGNRTSYPRWTLNVLITFLISGLWHGANITFIIWGLIHGILQVIENMIGKWFSKNKENTILSGWLLIPLNFMLVTFAWIFFRAESVVHALSLIIRIGIIEIPDSLSQLFSLLLIIGLDKFTLVVLSLSLSILFLVEYRQVRNKRVFYDVQGDRRNISYFAILLILWILVFGTFGNADFIYFKF